jgi:hypothetical protein
VDVFPASGELMLALSKGPTRLDASLPSPEDGNRFSFGNVVFSSYLEFRTMDKVKKPSDSAGFEEYVKQLTAFLLVSAYLPQRYVAEKKIALTANVPLGERTPRNALISS